MTHKQIGEYTLFLLLVAAALSWFNFRGLHESSGVSGDNLHQNCNQVRAIYLALLSREPDQNGLQAYCQATANGMNKKQIIDSILNSEEYKQ